MASYATNEFKSGLKVLVDGEPCSILENEVVKPGKGQAFNRVKFRNLRNSRVWERTFKSGESIEAADVMEIDMEYLYADGEFWHFMKTDGSFEQTAADASAISEADAPPESEELWEGRTELSHWPSHLITRGLVEEGFSAEEYGNAAAASMSVSLSPLPSPSLSPSLSLPRAPSRYRTLAPSRACALWALTRHARRRLRRSTRSTT